MRIFQPTYKDRRGKTQKTDRYHVAFKCHRGDWHRLIGFTDKEASKTLGEKLDKLAAYRANRQPLTPELSEWIDGLDVDVRKKLGEWDMIDSRALQGARLLTEHIAEWIADILNSGKTQDHADLLEARITKLFNACGFKWYTDLDAVKVNREIANMKRGTDERPSASIQTCNHYIRAAKQFCLWMVKNGRAVSEPLKGVEMGTVATDRRYIRRPLTPVEMTTIYNAAKASTAVLNQCTGPERALVYWLVWESGMRLKEVRTLLRESFDLDAEKPVVRVQATNTKNRKQVYSFNLRPDLAAALRLHLAKKLPGARAFSLGKRGAKMIQADCVAAGIDIGNALNRIDFHGNRNTFITNLGRANVPLVMAQKLARHSTPTLTANVYTGFNDDEKREAIAVLPKIASA